MRVRVGMLWEFSQSRIGLHSISLANMLVNATFFLVQRRSLRYDIRTNVRFHPTDPGLTVKDVYGFHIVDGMVLLPAFGAGFHALAVLAEKYGRPRIDPYLRWTSMFKVSMLWMKFVLLFYSRLKSGPPDCMAVAIVILSFLTVVVINIISLRPVFIFACGSEASKLYRWVSASFVVVDAVLLMIQFSAVAGLPTLAHMIQHAEIGMVLCLPGTYLVPTFALGNELSAAAQNYKQHQEALRAPDSTQPEPHPRVLCSGSIHVLALQCSWALLLNLVIDIVLMPAPTAAYFWGLLGGNWIHITFTCTTMALMGITSLVSATGEAHATSNEDVASQDTGISSVAAPSTI